MRSLLVVAAGLLAGLAAAADFVRPIDLTRHVSDQPVNLKPLGEAVYEWELPDGGAQGLTIDLPAQGIDPHAYDELRFEIMPIGSQVALQTKLHGLPADDQLSSWYLKFRTPVGVWTPGVYDLRIDDDGVYLSGRGVKEPGTLELRLSRRVLGFPGEPRWRRVRIRNPRLVKRRLEVSWQAGESTVALDGDRLLCSYTLHLRNLTDEPLSPRLEADSRGTLRHFSVTAPEQVALPAGGEERVEVVLGLPREQAMALPTLYAEPCLPRLSLPGLPDSDAVPMMSFRATPLWAVIPAFNTWTWTPATMQAYLDARAAVVPGLDRWRQGFIANADKAMAHDWPMPEQLPGHNQIYRCHDCGVWLKPVDVTKFAEHKCPKCGKIFTDERRQRAYVRIYLGDRLRDCRDLAMAWLISGEERYAEKAVRILGKFADKHPEMPCSGARSTAGAVKLGDTALASSYIVPSAAEAFWLLEESAALAGDAREQIRRFLVKEGELLARHTVEYSNQTAEILRGYGSVGMVADCWPLAAEAIHGDFGFNQLVEYGYSEDGIGHEAGVYHHSIFHAMNEFATFAHERNVNLYSARFKRVFDGSIVAGLARVNYELAYRVYRDPAYLGILAGQRHRANHAWIFHGIDGIPAADAMPVASAHMEGTGYVFLKTGNVADNRELRINYGRQFDRTEHDRFTTFFYRNGQQVDGAVHRITYGSPRSHWMYQTAAHSSIVIGGESQRDVQGELLAYAPELPAAVVGGELYEGVRQRRLVAIVDGNWVVVDQVSADRPVTIDRYQYGQGQARIAGLAAVEALPALPEPGQFHGLEATAPIAAGTVARAEWPNGLRMALVADQPLRLVKAITVGGYQAKPMETTFARIPEARTVTFAATFAFGDKATAPVPAIVESNDGALRLRIGERLLTWDANADSIILQ